MNRPCPVAKEKKIYLPAAKGKMTLQGRVEKMSWQEVVEA